jgi:hypothetical protein
MGRRPAILPFLLCAAVACALPRLAAAQDTPQDLAPPFPPGGRDAAGQYYNTAVRIRPEAAARYHGRALLVGIVMYNDEADEYLVKDAAGAITVLRGRDVEMIETYARTLRPPAYNGLGTVRCCDTRERPDAWWFVELRGWGYLTDGDDSRLGIGLDALTPGGEAVPGLRFGAWGVGIGAGFFRANGVDRMPLFLHGRWQLSCRCLAPYLYAQAGTVLDDQSGVNPFRPSNMFSTGPAMAGFGAGIDLALCSWLDLSADLGYRYLHLPTSVVCDCSNVPLRNEEVFHNESHGLLLRLGVTF